MRCRMSQYHTIQNQGHAVFPASPCPGREREALHRRTFHCPAPHRRVPPCPIPWRPVSLAHHMRPHPASLGHTLDSPALLLQAGVRAGCGECLWHTYPRLRPPLPSTRCDLIHAPFVRHHTLHAPPVTRRLCDEEAGSCPPSAKRAR
jgi:hypothetical protein